MRIKTTKEKISYTETQLFFENRVGKYQKDNPYSVTMYQDGNPELVRERNEKETKKILPLIELNEDSKVLDIACGIGRWSDAINVEIEEYCGIDFCEGLIQLAKERNKDIVNRHFYTGRSEQLVNILKENKEGKFNRILLIGSLMYLNDEDVCKTLDAIASICKKRTIICIREPIGLEERLTLKNQFSDELNDNYNAIYRSRDELVEFLNKTLIKEGFVLEEENFLFEEKNLNNRKETSQYYFVLKRK